VLGYLLWPFTAGWLASVMLVRQYSAHMRHQAEQLRKLVRSRPGKPDPEHERLLAEVHPMRWRWAPALVLFAAFMCLATGVGSVIWWETARPPYRSSYDYGYTWKEWDRLEEAVREGYATWEQNTVHDRYEAYERRRDELSEISEVVSVLATFGAGVLTLLGVIWQSASLTKALKRHTAAEALLVTSVAGLEGAARERELRAALERTRDGSGLLLVTMLLLGWALWPVLLHRHLRRHLRYVDDQLAGSELVATS
jgi:hypothetical protein